jgi:hypothetical protein
LVSGFIISEVVLPKLGISTINDRSWRSAHNLPLNFLVLFVGLHIAINWGWIIAAFKRRADNSKQSQKVFYPGFMVTLMRIGILVLVTSLVALLLYFIIGEPSPARLYTQNEVSRFDPTFSHGIGQLSGETFMIFLVAFIARKWLRIRL